MDTDYILLEKFTGSHPLQAAQAIEELTEEEIAAVLDEFHADQLIEVVKLMNKYKIAKCLKLIKMTQVVALIEKMEVQDAELILRQCDEDFLNVILNSISKKRALILQQKLRYKPLTVGSFMNPVDFSLKKEQTIKEAIKVIKLEKESLTSVIPVSTIDGKLEGLVKIHDLLLAEKNSLVESIMNTEIPKFSDDMSIESIIIHPGWYEYQSIPVTDSLNKLVGILDFETVYKHKIKSDAEKINPTAETASSLGELYRIGLSGFLQSIDR